MGDALGLGGKSGIDLPNEIEGIVPSTEWKQQRTRREVVRGRDDLGGDRPGQVSVTPMSMAVMMATVANGGTRVTPHLVKAVDDGQGWKPVPPPAPVRPMLMKTALAGAARWPVDGGQRRRHRRRGADRGRDVSGKTGTAQVISIQGKARAGATEKDLRDHGWFVFFAPRDNPEIAGVMFAEHAEHGYLAAPIAQHIIETYFAKKDG